MAGEVFALLAVEPGRWLVEQQHFRLECQRASEADDLLDAEAERADRLVPVALELDELDDALDRFALRALRRPGGRQKQRLREKAALQSAVPADEQIVEHAKMGQQFAVLEGARDATPGDRVRWLARDALAGEEHVARAGTVDAADAVQHASLAGAVRADEREELTSLDCE